MNNSCCVCYFSYEAFNSCFSLLFPSSCLMDALLTVSMIIFLNHAFMPAFTLFPLLLLLCRLYVCNTYLYCFHGWPIAPSLLSLSLHCLFGSLGTWTTVSSELCCLCWPASTSFSFSSRLSSFSFFPFIPHSNLLHYPSCYFYISGPFFPSSHNLQ